MACDLHHLSETCTRGHLLNLVGRNSLQNPMALIALLINPLLKNTVCLNLPLEPQNLSPYSLSYLLSFNSQLDTAKSHPRRESQFGGFLNQIGLWTCLWEIV